MSLNPISRELIAAMAKGPIPFADFMRTALYHPQFGYYKQERERVGFGKGTDFFTATSTGAVFGELLVAACASLLAPGDPQDFTFVEIGAEPGGGVLPESHPFGASRILRHGEPFAIPDQAVVFSNELFDAQPFHRLVFAEGQWREIGVAWSDGFEETLLPDLSPAIQAEVHRLPADAPEGYHLDLPLQSVDLLKKIVGASPWRGLIVIFDYGKSWRELVEATPQGTARAYSRHRQSNDLLASPGEQDLTCHICWDWLEAVLEKQNFSAISLQSQEAFFVTRATRAIEAIVNARPGEIDPRRQTLQQLLYPGHMGQKFQVLTGKR